MAEMMRPRGGSEPAPELAGLIRSLIQKDASRNKVDATARKIEQSIAENKDARQEVGRIATTIVRSGKLTEYGTEPAQHYLQKWAKEYGTPADATGDKPPKPGERK